MIKRTIEISGNHKRLTMKNDQLLVFHHEDRIGKVPIEDIGVCIIDTPSAVYTHSTLIRIAESGGLVVLCGTDHHPVAMIEPIAGNTLQTRRLRLQVQAKKPLQKQL